MKKLSILILLTFFSFIGNAQTSLKGCMGINFGDSKAKVRQVMSTKNGFELYKDDEVTLSYLNGTFAGHEAIGAVFAFYQNQLHTAVILLKVEQEPKVMDFYYEILGELKDRYSMQYQSAHVYRSPYYAGDGYTVTAIKLGYADIGSAFSFDDGNVIAVDITNSIGLKLTYQDGALIKKAIEQNKEKNNQDY